MRERSGWVKLRVKELKKSIFDAFPAEDLSFCGGLESLPRLQDFAENSSLCRRFKCLKQLSPKNLLANKNHIPSVRLLVASLKHTAFSLD